jgi:AraC-like DNA-binding protein
MGTVEKPRQLRNKTGKHGVPAGNRDAGGSPRASSGISLSTTSSRDLLRPIGQQVNAAGVHEWPSDLSCPVDVVFLTDDGRHHVSMSRHRYFEVIYLYSGSAECRIGSRRLQIHEGDLAVIGSDLHHSIVGLSSPITIAALFFEPELICDGSCDGPEYLIPFLFQDSDFPHVVPASTGIPSQVLNTMLRMHSEMPATSSRSRLTVKTYLKMVLILLLKHFASSGRTWETLQNQRRALGRLQPVFHYVRDNCERTILVVEAARIAGMSESRFMNFFKKATGLSFVRYLNRYRIELAQALLATSDESLTSICHKLGFCDQSHFGMVFRRLVGATPAAYRRRCQKAAVDGATYTTSFPRAEDPISENIHWINGKTVGLDWSDFSSAPGLAFGLQPGPTGCDDAVAILTGSWKPDQMAQATIHTVHQNDAIVEEVELRLRSSLSAHNSTGYEIMFRCSKTSNAYVSIARWNGPLDDFNILTRHSGSQYGVADGDVIKATIVGNLIRVYKNDIQIDQVADNKFTSGNPGIGAYVEKTTGVNDDYGFTSFTASDASIQG